MKTITILLVTVLLNACGNAKTAVNAEEKSSKANETMQVSKTEQENVKITYRSHTRGSFKKIILENKSISVQNNHSEKPIVKACPEKEWNDLMQMVSKINLKSMSTFEAPSKAHQYDGAPIASFSITKDGNVFEVPAFDGGKPNKNIASIVNMLINIAKQTKG